MKKIIVDLGGRSYPIYIGAGLLRKPDLFGNLIKGSQVLIVTNAAVGPIYLSGLMDTIKNCKGGLLVDHLILPDGEQYKNLATLSLVYDHLLESRHERNTTLIALGGGVVGDITGFAAASYQRGVNLIHIPTTLLSQVDSSVGGKTGVNHSLGKNMIGAFYQPQGVIIDTNTLGTLPDREMAAGLAEVIKYGLITDPEFFSWLEKNIAVLVKRDIEVLTTAIERSCRNKSEVVSADERESGRRALLNLGHTFGHAIESNQGYGDWLHGEAVAAGIAVAAHLSQKLGWISSLEVTRVESLLKAAGLPTRIPVDMTPEDFFEKMQLDKKVKDGEINFVLLKAIGEAVVAANIPRSIVIEALDACSSR